MSELRGVLNLADAMATRSAVRDVAELLGIERVRTRTTAAAEVGGKRRLTIQCIDRRGQLKEGRYFVWVVIETGSWDGPGGDQVVSAPVAGVLVETLETDQSLIYLTDAAGKVQMDVEANVSATRRIASTVVGEAAESEVLTWASVGAGRPSPGGGSGWINLDGGGPTTNYGGVTAIDCGGV